MLGAWLYIIVESFDLCVIAIEFVISYEWVVSIDEVIAYVWCVVTCKSVIIYAWQSHLSDNICLVFNFILWYCVVSYDGIIIPWYLILWFHMRGQLHITSVQFQMIVISLDSVFNDLIWLGNCGVIIWVCRVI